MRVIHTGDWHLKGSTLAKGKEAIKQFMAKVGEIKPDVIVISGDVFERSNVSDRSASVGDLQRIILDMVHVLRQKSQLVFIYGNHCVTGQHYGSLEFLRNIKNVTVVDRPTVLDFNGNKIGCLPFIDKGVFYSKHCVGISKSEADAKFNTAITSMLGYFKACFAGYNNGMLFGHCDIQGVQVNAGYQIQGGQSFCFTSGLLEATGAKYIGLSHIHKRIPPYVGSLFQGSHSDEGYSQGFDFILSNEDGITESYITLDLPEFKTVEINSDQDVIDFDYQPEKYEYKLRFYSESAFNRADPAVLAKCEVERLWNKRKYVARTEQTLTASMSVAELLQSYIKINPIPNGVTEKELMEVVG